MIGKRAPLGSGFRGLQQYLLHARNGAASRVEREMSRPRLEARLGKFEPGTDRSYSNGGYAVAAKILELEVGASFDDAMRELVFAPLAMSGTGHIADARLPIPGMATGYEPGPRPGERRHAEFYAVETRPGGGSLYSTARDLLLFARAVFREGRLEAPLAESVLGADGGPFIAQGRSPGFVAKLLFEPARDVIVVSLANNHAVPADWAATIADLATGEVKEAPWPPIDRVAGSVAESDPRLGRYRNSRGGAHEANAMIAAKS